MRQDTNTSDVDLNEMARFARDAARAAGQRAHESFRRPIAIDIKSDASPVTAADRMAETLLREMIAAAWPGHAVLGEEFGLTGPADAPTWIVDPIDGTRSFITGWPIWGTLLALTRHDRPLLGVIEMPALGECWVARQGGGSWFHAGDRPAHLCTTSGCTTLRQARLYTTSPDYFDAGERPAFDAVSAAAGVTRFGGDCYSYGLLASGHIDLIVESRLQPYDFMALAPVVEEAGGVITDWTGARLTRHSGEQVVAAATPQLHKEAIDRILSVRA